VTELEKRFAVRYYQWAKGEFRREVESGFPLLSTLRNSVSLTIPEFIATLPDDEQWRFALALLRRGAHRLGAELCDEPLSAKEQRLLDSYYERTKVNSFVGTLSRVGPSTKEDEIRAAVERGTMKWQRSDKRFRELVRQKTSNTLGRPVSEDTQGPNGAVSFATAVGGWTVHTVISLSGANAPLRYTQVVASPHEPGFNRHVSFLSWLGIAGDTAWDLLTADVAEEAVETLVILCRRFLREAPAWLPSLIR
jgi:hypothetical protein